MAIMTPNPLLYFATIRSFEQLQLVEFLLYNVSRHPVWLSPENVR